MTRYESKYETRWSHKMCDSRDIGGVLANTFLTILDPTNSEIPFEKEGLLKFKESKKVEAYLPGNLCYFHFHEPVLELDETVSINL